MTLYYFNSLEEKEQAETVWEGAFIADREDKEYRILLYQIDSFYVEVFYHKENNKIERFKSFATTRLLEPYLGSLDLNNLINP